MTTHELLEHLQKEVGNMSLAIGSLSLHQGETLKRLKDLEARLEAFEKRVI